MTYRLTLFHSLSAFVVAYMIYFHDAFSRLWQLEKTRVSFLIIVIYIMCSIYLVIKQKKANLKAIRYYGSRLPLLGLAGTVIATMMVFHGASDLEAFKQHLFAEMSPVFLTTFFGIVGAFLTDMQLGICAGDYENGE